MAQVGDQTIVVNVIQADIDAATVGDYTTSLAHALSRVVTNFVSAGFSPLGYTISLIDTNSGVLYNLDVVSISFCNLERLGIKVTIPYTATLTFANNPV